MRAQHVLDVVRDVTEASQAWAAEWAAHQRDKPGSALRPEHMPSHARVDRAKRRLSELIQFMPSKAAELDELETLARALRLARDALAQGKGLKAHVAANGPTIEDVIEKALRTSL